MVELSFRFDQGGTNVRIIGRSALCLTAALTLSGFFFQQARADVLYSVTNLGPAGPTTGGLYPNPGYPYLNSQTLLYPNGNYLGALSQSQQATFQAGSFDIYAHPATTSLSGLGFYPGNGGYTTVDYQNSSSFVAGVNLTTSNNLGVAAGTAYEGGLAGDQNRLVVFTPDPQLISLPYPSNQQVQNPGVLGVFTDRRIKKVKLFSR